MIETRPNFLCVFFYKKGFNKLKDISRRVDLKLSLLNDNKLSCHH